MRYPRNLPKLNGPTYWSEAVEALCLRPDQVCTYYLFSQWLLVPARTASESMAYSVAQLLDILRTATSAYVMRRVTVTTTTAPSGLVSSRWQAPSRTLGYSL